MNKISNLNPGDVFFHNSEYFVKSLSGFVFSLTNNDIRFIRGDTDVEVVKGVMQITHDRGLRETND